MRHRAGAGVARHGQLGAVYPVYDDAGQHSVLLGHRSPFKGGVHRRYPRSHGHRCGRSKANVRFCVNRGREVSEVMYEGAGRKVN